MIKIIDAETGEITEYTEPEYFAKRDKLLTDWQAEDKKLSDAKTEEMRLRKEIIAFCFDPTVKKGTQYCDLGNGWKLKGGKKISYGWRKDKHDELDRQGITNALDAIVKLSERGQDVAIRLVKWQPELSLSQYKLLTPEESALIDAVIVTKEGAPDLEILPPKEKQTKPVWKS